MPDASLPTPTAPSPAPELAYAPRPRLVRLRRWRLRILLIALVIAIALPVYHYRKSLILRATWLHWSNRCASHEMPRETELVVTDPERVQQLLAEDPDYVARPAGSVSSASTRTSPVAVYCPRAWRELAAVDGRCNALASPWGIEPIAFLGSLRRPDGVSRLVVVQGSGTNGLRLLSDIHLLVLPHAAALDRLPATQNRGFDRFASGRYVFAALRAGQIDPNDPSHVTFELVVYGGRNFHEIEAKGTLDAYLQNDDSLHFSLRDDPELIARGVKLIQDSLRSVVPTTNP